jgi:hypothetical protein
MAAGVADRFWTEIEADPDTNAAFVRLAAELDAQRLKSAPPVRGSFHGWRDGRARSERYGLAALVSELGQLAQVEEGERNNALNASSYKVGRIVGAGLLDEGYARDRLEDCGRFLGLAPSEVRATVKSGFEAGKERPR